jgi:hypothetical protein
MLSTLPLYALAKLQQWKRISNSRALIEISTEQHCYLLMHCVVLKNLFATRLQHEQIFGSST